MKQDEKGNWFFESDEEFMDWTLSHCNVGENLEALYDYFVIRHKVNQEVFNKYFSDSNENELNFDDNEEFWEYFEQKYVK